MNQLNHQRWNRLYTLIGTVLMAVYLVGCTNPETLPPTIATPTSPTTHFSNQMQPTNTDTPRSTVTPTPVVDAGSPTRTPAPLPPILMKAEALAFIMNMQETNGSCELPCWWGITPGETTEQVAKLILSPLRSFKGLRSDIGFHLDEYADIDVGIYTRDQVVTEIWGFSSISDADQSTQYHPSWRRYFLSELLTRLGMPSQVWLGFGLHTGDHDERSPESIPYYYELHVIYSELGLVVRYAGPAIRGDPNRACLSLEQLKDMRIFIRRRSAGPLAGPPWEAFTGEPTSSLSEVTDLSLEEFYETFKNSNGQTCLDSPAKFWP